MCDNLLYLESGITPNRSDGVRVPVFWLMTDDSRSLLGRPTLSQKYLIVPKFLYIGVNLVVYSVHAYGTDFFRRQWDLKLSEIGYISALSGFNFIGSIFWSSLADKTGKHRIILCGCTAAYAMLMFALNFHFGSGNSNVAKILYTAGCFGLAQFVLSALFPLVDNQVMSILSADPALSKDTFGRQRLWGTFAHTGVTLLANQANKWYLVVRGDSPWLKSHLGDYLGMFLVLILSAVVFIFTVSFGIPKNLLAVPAQGGHHQAEPEKPEDKIVEEMETAYDLDVDKAENEILHHKNDAVKVVMHREEHDLALPNNKSPALRLLAIPAFLFFILVVLISGVIRSSMSFFQAYFIIALHNGNQTGKDQAALVALPRILSEVGVYFFGKQLLHALGPYWMLIISQGTGILRMLGYAAMPTKGAGSWVFPYFLELLKGLNAGLFSSSAVRLACDMAPDNCGNTAQGIVAGTYAGMSTVLGGLIGGFIVSFFPSSIEGERRGMQAMFFILSSSGSLFLVLFILKYWIVDGLLCTRPRSHQ